MQPEPVDLERDAQGDVHVYPTFGQPHFLDGLRCWCHPERDAECASVIVHQVLH